MLIDTSGWFCIMDDNDHRYEGAKRYVRTARRRLTHSFIVAELTALSHARGIPKRSLIRVTNEILDDPGVEVIWVDEPLAMKAWSLLQERQDKNWSLCDAVSFVLMKQLGITEALTTDHHFEQAGFVKPLDS
jgi:predicted nucleic acid-binding protein